MGVDMCHCTILRGFVLHFVNVFQRIPHLSKKKYSEMRMNPLPTAAISLLAKLQIQTLPELSRPERVLR